MNKKLLIVAYRFPPSASSGTFRSLGFVRHLAPKKWQLEVLTINEQNNESPDKLLLDRVPQNVKIIRAPVFDPFSLWARIRRTQSRRDAVIEDNGSNEEVPRASTKRIPIKAIVTHFLKTPDNHIGWLIPAVCKFFKLSKPTLIYSSAPPFTGHLVATVLKKIWRIPMVCDFRDPWLDNPFRSPRPGWVESWEQWLEQWVYKNADIIIANTEPMAEAFKRRHPEAGSRIYVITNGYDPEDFRDIQSVRDVSPDKYLLLHAGSLYGQRDPRQFLKGLKIAIEKIGHGNLNVQLIGPSEIFGGKSLAEYVCEMNLEAYVDIIASISHNQVLKRMKGADTLLLFSQGTDLQVPAKIYEYMGLGKNIFAIVEPNSATARIMKNLDSTHFSIENDAELIAKKLVNAYALWKNTNTNIGSTSDSTQQFLRSSLTDQLEKLMISTIEPGQNQ